MDLTKLEGEEILALTIIGEARGEPVEGQIAVACVIRNRVNSSSHSSYTLICLADKQFSCWNKDDPNRKMLEELADEFLLGDRPQDPYIKQCVFIASGIAKNDLLDNTGGARNYVTKGRLGIALARRAPEDKWIINMKTSKEINNHVFLI